MTDPQLTQHGEALGGERVEVGDSVLRDLRVRNAAKAVIDGGLGARAELGALIGRLLIGEEDSTCHH